MASRNYTPEEIAYVKKYYADYDTQDMARILECKENRIYRIAGMLGIKKSAAWWAADLAVRKEILPAAGAKFRYPKGHTPANKGQQKTAAQREKVKHTWFKPGHEPANTKSDGDIIFRTETKSGRKYMYLRLSKARWIHYHVHHWQRHHGPVPPGHCLWFRDGDTMNVTLDNLELITRAERMRRNTIQNIPVELRPVQILINKINTKCRKTRSKT